jgi:hypothetical protein
VVWLHLVASKRGPTPKLVVAAEAETSSGTLKMGKLFCALVLHQPTFALKLIKARGIFLDVKPKGEVEWRTEVVKR